MTLTIAGAGLAGLLCGQMLHRRQPVILEQQALLPNNHSAVLRFRSSLVGDTLGIPFRRVSMIKTAATWRNPVADALSYSFKASGVSRSDRSINAGFVAEERFIAPPDLISRMAKDLNIRCGEECEFMDGEGPFISTIPMPQLMTLLEYPDRSKIEFNSRPGVNLKAIIAHCDAYISLLVPDPEEPFHRLSITGNELIVEASESANDSFAWMMERAAFHLGLAPDRISEFTQHRSQYAKILPIPDEERKAFMHWATDHFKIFSVGRFACWRPGLLLDDLVKDIRLVDGWLGKLSGYDIARHR